MRIVLLGAPGSGKGTQATLLKERLSVPHISTGDLLRAAVKADSPLGREAKAVMERGELVSDEIVLGMLEERLKQPDAAAGFILDGYPRNPAQANALDLLLERLGQPVDSAVQLDVAEQTLLGRLVKRGTDQNRVDDSPETVRRRLGIYLEQTAPVIDHFEAQGRLTRIKGEGTVDEIAERIVASLRT